MKFINPAFAFSLALIAGRILPGAPGSPAPVPATADDQGSYYGTVTVKRSEFRVCNDDKDDCVGSSLQTCEVTTTEEGDVFCTSNYP
ncbi:MAG: hypothetical protein AAF682_14450 [Planctomycetota bacterium]